MLSVDYIYLVMKDVLESKESLRDNFRLIYAYDKKIEAPQVIYLYEINRVQDFYGIGGRYTIEDYVVSVSVLVDRKHLTLLADFQDALINVFYARHDSFWVDENNVLVLQEGVDYDEVKNISAYIDKVNIINTDISLQRGDIVEIGGRVGFVWNSYSDGVYIFYGEGEYILTKFERMMNSSERYKYFYEMSFDITGKIIRKKV